MRTKWIAVGAAVAFLAAAAAVGWTIRQARREAGDREQLARARAEIEAGRLSTASTSLKELLDRRPGWDEALYEFGVCERARGRTQGALKAWSQIPDESRLKGWVDAQRSRIEMDLGRFTTAEALLRSAAERPGSQKAEARWGLVLLLRIEGRLDEAKHWLEAGFPIMTSPEETLQRLYRLDHDPYPIEGVEKLLKRAGERSPSDDGVWLGKAHLNVLLNRLDEAKAWLDRCSSRRKDDPAYWRIRLDWALASDLPEDVLECLGHIPAEHVDASKIRLWLAERSGDDGAERAALEARLQADPIDARARERLAQLEIKAGRPEAAAAQRARKTEGDALDQDYRRLLFGPRPSEQATQLAELADRLGRAFDSARWTELASGAGTPSLAAVKSNDASLRAADLIPESLRFARFQGRPRAKPGEDAAPGLAFDDDAETSGLIFTQDNGDEHRSLIPPVTSSGGVALLDYDGDGWLDVYFVQGGPFPPTPGKPSADRLFRNRRDGSFEDVSERSGIAAMPGGYGHGAAVGDYDGDGRPDLFVTRWRSYALYRNLGDGRFEDATPKAGLDGDRDWPTSAAFADLDGDGDLDLYVCHYLKWDENEPRSCIDRDDPAVYHCSPLDFDALSDHVFRNDGGRFVDVTRESGFHETQGRGLGVVAADLDEDGKIDVFVANDMTADYLFQNKGGFQFVENGLSAGVSSNASGANQAGMGVACGDLDGDGRPDLAVTNYYDESTTYFHNLGDGFFGDESAAVGVAGPSRYLLGFGIAFLDADDDGRLDLMTANGHVFDGRPQFPWRMPVQILRNVGDGRARMVDVSRTAGPPFAVLRMGRGLAAGDLDNDGRVDAVAVSQNQAAAYLHNRTPAGRSLTLLLQGTTSNRDAVGATVTVHAGGRRLKAQRVGGGSYQSASDPRLHFGLGTAERADAVEVRWPSGRVDRYPPLEARRGCRLVEGDPAPHDLIGWDRKH